MGSLSHASVPRETPAEALAQRLDDPKVAESLNVLLDHAELLATLVQGLSGFIARSDTIVDAVAAGVGELKQAAEGQTDKLPSLSEAGAIAGQLADALPVAQRVLQSEMLNPDTIDMLAEVGAAGTEGFETARRQNTQVSLFGALGAMRDPQVQRGLGVAIEVAKALGRRMEQKR